MKIGPYEVQRELSRSSRAVTFAAADPARGAVLLTLVRAHPAEVARFESERKITDALTLADGFVPLLDAGSSEQGHYLVQPALPGDSLREVVRAGASALDLVRLVKGVAAALARAHDRGLVHGDLRPESIHVSDGQPFVVDLALARSFPAEGSASSYAAPEVRRGPPTPRSDVFSLAAIAREALQGRESSGVRRALERASSRDEAARFPDARSFLGALGGGALPALHAMTRVDDSQPSHEAIPTPATPARGSWRPLLVAGLVLAASAGAVVFEVRRRALDASVRVFLDEALRPSHDPAACLALGEALPEAARERPVVKGAIATLRSETHTVLARAAAQAALAALPDDARPEVRLETAEKALALDPRSSRALLERARARLLVGRGDAKKLHAARLAAREDLERAGDLAPARIELAFLLLREPDSRARAASELEKVAQDPRDAALAALAGGEAAFVAHRFADARAAFTKAIESARDPGPALLERARLALATGTDAAAALEDANKALALAPSSARALVLRARARARRAQEGERPPLPDLDRAIEIDALSAEAWAWRSVLRYRAGDAAGAIQDANHAHELDEGDAAVLYAMAQILGTAPGARAEPVADRRRNDEARRLLGDALARDPELAEALVLDQSLALYAGDPAAAVERGERALALQPENLGVLANHALALARTSRTDEAKTALDRAVLLAPENTSILYLRGKFRVELLHDWQGAVADLTRVLAEDSAPADAWLERGIALCNLGQFHEGIADLDQGERVAPSNAPWLANLRAAREEARARSGR